MSIQTAAAAELRQCVERIERMKAEISDLNGDIKDEFTVAKSRGYDVKVLRKLIALRARDPAEVSEEEAVLELYKQALGMAGTPLDAWAKEREDMVIVNDTAA
jgi:uncharacterized protein (UPF0335 family)